MFPELRTRLDGAPLALPRLLDTLSERWWAARPRARTAVAIGVTALLVTAGVAHAASSPHGPPTPVLVATRDLPVGRELGPGDLTRATWPRDLVPAGASLELSGTVVAALPRGAVATDRHVSPTGIGAALPAGTVAVALPVDALPELPPGARIDLVAADLDGRARVLATRATVVASDATAVWVAVDDAAAAGVAAAGLGGALGVVVRPA